MNPRAILPPVVVLLALGAAQPASAATIALSRPCLNSESPSLVTGAGFTPGATVTFSHPNADFQAVAAPDGSVNARFPAPLSLTTADALPLAVAYTATDGTNAATTSVQVVRPGLVLPKSGRTRNKMRILMTGFEPGKVVYAHLRWGEKWRKRFKIGTATGPCGSLQTDRKLFRKTGSLFGRQIYAQFDQNPKASTATHQTAFARLIVSKGARNNPNEETYRVQYNRWRDRTTT